MAVVADQSMASVLACWAVMKAGAAYVPIDIETPKKRFDYCLDAAHVDVLLVSEDNAATVPDCDTDMLFLPSPCDNDEWFSEYSDRVVMEPESLISD